jgi:hypothetical protein
MLRERLFDLLRRRPFRPFRLHLTDGRRFDIVYPELNIAGRTLFTIGVPEVFRVDPFADHFVDVDYQMIRDVEMLPGTPPAAG